VEGNKGIVLLFIIVLGN